MGFPVSPSSLHGRRIRAGGLRVAFDTPTAEVARVHILLDDRPCMPAVPVSITNLPASMSQLNHSGNTVPILRYPGQSRHPAGSEAGISWFNDLGEGWLHIIQPNRVIIVPLQGWEFAPESAAIPIRNVKGPARSMDLWLATAALLDPLHISSTMLQASTGINGFNVHDFIKRALHLGWLTPLPNWRGRGGRFFISPDQIPIVAEFARASWEDWRSGRIRGRVACVRRYFVASLGWQDFASIAGSNVVPTGVTWLEGNGGGTKRISPLGSIPRLQFLCASSAWNTTLFAATQITPRNQRERPYDSEVTVLPEDHPIWHLIRHRQAANFSPAWPAGFRALDSLTEQEPRVREAAQAAWTDWVEQQRIHTENLMAGVR
jgi:hypothetical protein